MTRRAGWVAVTASLVLAIGLTGAAFAKPLSKPDYIEAADNICRQSQILIDEAGQGAFGTLGPDELPTADQQEAFSAEIEPTIAQELSSLRELPAPKADAKKLKKMFKLVEKGYGQIVADPLILFGSDPPPALVKASKQAAAYGFEVCGA